MIARATALLLCSVLALGQKTDTAAERIRRVESGLLPRTVPKGKLGIRYPILERMRHHKVPGASIAVIDQFQVVWAKGYGVVENGTSRPVTPETLFQAGSISKAVAALGALRLVQEGALSLDEDVNNKLKSWKVPENEFTKRQKVTLRRILSHSAGLTVHGFPGYAIDAPAPTLIQVLDGAGPANTQPVRVDVVPGSRQRYSGGGYTVMQLLIGDVTGKSFPAFMAETALKPLGLRDSSYEQPLSDAWRSRAATAHKANGEKVRGRFHVYPEMAAAGLWTTAGDLARVAIEVQKSASGRSNLVLSAEMTQEMLGQQSISDSSAWGLGWTIGVRGASVNFGHGGRDEGFDAILDANVQSGQGAVIMINANNNTGFVREVLDAIATEYRWRGHRIQQIETESIQ